MKSEWGLFLKQMIALFVIINPVGALPMFLALTDNQTDTERNQSARRAATTVAIVLIVSFFAGEAVLASVGVSLPAFRIAGGILLLMMAIAMLQAQPSGTKQTREETQEAEAKASVAVVPIAIPLLTGPGAISTAILYSNEVKGLWPVARMLVGMVLIALLAWVVLRAAQRVNHLLGRIGINIMTRLMGMLLAANAVEFIADGIVQMFPRLAAHG